MNKPIIAIAAIPLIAAVGCGPANYDRGPTATATQLPPTPVGTVTQVAGTITSETAVYNEPVPSNVAPPERKWTLLPGSPVTVLCLAHPGPDPSYIDVYISWAPESRGYVSGHAVDIAERTKTTNERIYLYQVKPC